MEDFSEKSALFDSIRRKESAIVDGIFLSAEIRAANEDRSVDVIASTDMIDSYGDKLEQKWDLTRYRANPVVLFAHNSRELPIGRASDVDVVDGKLRATLHFVEASINPKAEEVFRAVRAGVLRAVSVGFKPHSYRWEKEGDREIFVLSDNELLEISVVPVPANPEALIAMKSAARFTRQIAGIPSSPPEKKQMDPEFLEALGLTLGASKAEILAAIRARNADAVSLRQVLSAAGVDSASGAVGRILSAFEAEKSVESMRVQIESQRVAGETLERATLIDNARRAGKLTPGIEEGADWKALASGHIAELRTAVKRLSPQVPRAVEQKSTNAPNASEAQLTAEDLAACKAAGQDPAAFLEMKRQLSAGKAA